MNSLSRLAMDQLTEWEAIAVDYLLIPFIRPETGELHLECPRCRMSVYAVQHQSVSPAILLAATVSHLRNMHRELDPDA